MLQPSRQILESSIAPGDRKLEEELEMFSTGRKVLSLAVVAITAWLAVPLIAQAQNGASAQAPDAFARAVARQATVLSPNDRSGRLGIGSQTTATAAVPDAFERAVTRHATVALSANNRGGQLGIGSQTTATAAVPDAFERAVVRHATANASSGSAVVRPDDRMGMRGIGLTAARGRSGSAPTFSTSGSSVWLTVGLVALAIALALALMAAARIVTRRQLAHS